MTNSEKTTKTTHANFLDCQQSDATITNCTINNNSAPTGGGISCKGGPGPSIAYCTLMHNTADTGRLVKNGGGEIPGFFFMIKTSGLGGETSRIPMGDRENPFLDFIFKCLDEFRRQ